MKASSIIIGAALALSVLLNVFLLKRKQETNIIYVHDTLRIEHPVPIWEELVYVDTVWLEKVVIHRVESKVDTSEETVNDTMRVSNRLASGHTNGRPKSTIQGYVNDSVPVLIPITERTFKSNNYKAVVSGFDPKLVSLDIYSEKSVVHHSSVVYKQPPIALTIGPYMGYGNKGFNYGIALQLGIPVNRFFVRNK